MRLCALLLPGLIAVTTTVACSRRTGDAESSVTSVTPAVAAAATGGTTRGSSGPATSPVSLGAVASKEALLYPVGITALTGFEEILAAGRNLPALYSETYSTSEDDQKTFHIALGQRRPGGVEKICEFTIDGVPPGPKTTQTFIVTVEVDEAKMLKVKTRIQSSGSMRVFGPFPVD